MAEPQRGSPLPHTAWSQLEAVGGTKRCRVVQVLVQPHTWCEWDSCTELSALKCSFHPSFCSSHESEPSPSHHLQQPVAFSLSWALGSHCCLGRGLTGGDYIHGWHQTSYFNPPRNKTSQWWNLQNPGFGWWFSRGSPQTFLRSTVFFWKSRWSSWPKGSVPFLDMVMAAHQTPMVPAASLHHP